MDSYQIGENYQVSPGCGHANYCNDGLDPFTIASPSLGNQKDNFTHIGLSGGMIRGCFCIQSTTAHNKFSRPVH